MSNQPEPPATVPTAPEERRLELRRLKEEFSQGAAAQELAALVAPDDQTDAELEQFMLLLKERKGRRKQNLDLLKQFFDDPQKLNVRMQGVPSSTTAEEITQRCGEIDYQIKLLRAILETLEGERQLLAAAAQAASPAQSGKAPEE
ncbi:MAG: hypothetical protein ACRET6_05255 [Burkholderiales bacterium]